MKRRRRTRATPASARAVLELAGATRQAPTPQTWNHGETPAGIRCTLRLGSVLLGYGLPVHRVEESVNRLARAFGYEAGTIGLPTALMITFRQRGQSDMYTVRAEPGVVDLERLDKLHALVGRVERHELDVAAANDEVDAILSARPRYGRVAVGVASAATGGGTALLLGGGLRDAIASSVFGALNGALLALAAKRIDFARIIPVIAALSVSLGAVSLSDHGVPIRPAVLTLGALIVLLPGLTLTLATIELATGHLVCGTSRLMGAATTFMQLGFGVLLGASLGANEATMPMSPAVLPPMVEIAGALGLALGFGVLLGMPPRDLGWVLGVSGLAYGTARFVGVELGPEIGALAAATVVGVMSQAFARRYDRPSSILLLPGILMLEPGSIGMLSLSSLIAGDTTSALTTGFRMVMVAMALSTGVVLGTVALPARETL
jgi:uncharacterized membrane protein YjjP (DUF1212 family)